MKVMKKFFALLPPVIIITWALMFAGVTTEWLAPDSIAGVILIISAVGFAIATSALLMFLHGRNLIAIELWCFSILGISLLEPPLSDEFWVYSALSTVIVLGGYATHQLGRTQPPKNFLETPEWKNIQHNAENISDTGFTMMTANSSETASSLVPAPHPKAHLPDTEKTP